jgi:choline dehydrogenase-like flavoprotein
MTGKIWTASDREGGVTLDCDVCIVGSGAGGAVAASVLCRRGLSVVLLEAGGHFQRDDFDLDERKAYTQFYQDRGLRTTADAAITVLQGKSVGGGTTVNWTTCFRTPDRVLSIWAERFGIHGLSPADLAPHFDAMEQRLSIRPWSADLANANNRVILRGCEALGLETKAVSRNVLGCANSGYCGLGCPYDAKQGMLLTTLPDAVAAGLQLIPRARVQRIEMSGGRAVGVHAEVLHEASDRPTGDRIAVRARVTVLAGGAINSPALLLRSGLDVNDRVGKRTFLHPVVSMTGVYAERIEGYFGAPQSITSHAFVDRGKDMGYFIETAPLQPMLAASALCKIGPAQGEFMRQLPNLSALIALMVDGLDPDADGGTISLHSDGRPIIDYAISSELVEGFRDAHVRLAEIHLAAGAVEAISLHREPISVRNSADLKTLREAPFGAHQHSVFSAHQMGGCAMGGDADRSVVDVEHQVRGTQGLYVIDGSVLPTSLGVNPSETIYALAHRASGRLADRLLA